MKPSDYFKQLGETFEGHPYKDRLLEELQDHLEDFQEDKKTTKSEKISEEIKKIFDTPHQFKKIFIAIVDPWRDLFFVSEALLVGIVLALASLMFYANLTSITNIQYLWREMTLNMVFILAIWFIGHLLALRLFLGIKNFSNLGVRTWITLINLPGLLLCSYKAYPQLMTFSELDIYDIGPAVWLFTNFLILFLSFGVYKKEKTKSGNIEGFHPLFLLNTFLFTVLVFLDFKDVSVIRIIAIAASFLLLNVIVLWLHSRGKKKGQAFKLNSSFIFWFAISGIFLRTALTYTDVNFWGNHSYLLLPLFPIFLVDTLFESLWFIDVPNLPLQYVPLIIIIYIIFQSAFVLLRRKTLQYGHSLLLTYCLSFFFINNSPFILHPDFKKDSIPISENMEQDQWSIFYPYIRYFNADKTILFKTNLDLESYKYNFFHYEIALYTSEGGKNYFAIKNFNMRDTYFIDIDELNDIGLENIKKLLQKNLFDIDISSYPYNLQDVTQKNPNCPPPTCVSGFSLHPNLMNEYSKVEVIDVKENELPFTVNGLKISPDKKWLLTVLESNKKSDFGEEVHLIKLNE